MEWPAVRQLLQGVVPQSYWTALECHDDGAWTAFTPGLPVDGGKSYVLIKALRPDQEQIRMYLPEVTFCPVSATNCRQALLL